MIDDRELGPLEAHERAGAQMKFSMAGTFACDACWEEFKKKVKEQKP